MNKIKLTDNNVTIVEGDALFYLSYISFLSINSQKLNLFDLHLSHTKINLTLYNAFYLKTLNFPFYNENPSKKSHISIQNITFTNNEITQQPKNQNQNLFFYIRSNTKNQMFLFLHTINIKYNSGFSFVETGFMQTNVDSSSL